MPANSRDDQRTWTSWDVLDRWQPTPEEKAEQDRHHRAVTRVLSSDDGKVMMEYLRSITRPALPPSVSDAELRHLEGQRALVQHIEWVNLKGQNSDV